MLSLWGPCVSSVLRTVGGSRLCSQRCEAGGLQRRADLFLTQPPGIILEGDTPLAYQRGKPHPPKTVLPIPWSLLYCFSHWIPILQGCGLEARTAGCPISQWGGWAGVSAWRGYLPEASCSSQRRESLPGWWVDRAVCLAPGLISAMLCPLWGSLVFGSTVALVTQ